MVASRAAQQSARYGVVLLALATAAATVIADYLPGPDRPISRNDLYSQ